MENSLPRSREVGSFIAGLLIGLSMIVLVSAMMVADPSNWQTLWVFGAPIILALGLALQVVVTTKPRHRRTTGPVPVLETLSTGFMTLSHEG